MLLQRGANRKSAEKKAFEEFHGARLQFAWPEMPYDLIVREFDDVAFEADILLATYLRRGCR
jgi:hypothetical protein